MNLKRCVFGGMLMLALAVAPFATTGAQESANEEAWQLSTVHRVAQILDVDGNQVGTVGIGDEEGLGLMVIISGLPPGVHGIHLHEAGSCEAADDKAFGAAGGHFNPGGMSHPNHAGDLGNVTVDDNGNAMLIGTLGVATYDDGAWGLADADGTALVIHESADDLATDPSGNSGGRIACAVLAPPVA